MLALVLSIANSKPRASAQLFPVNDLAHRYDTNMVDCRANARTMHCWQALF